MTRLTRLMVLTLIATAFGAAPARATDGQTPEDRADPSVVEEELTRAKPEAQGARGPAKPTLGGETTGRSAIDQPIAVRAVIVDGATELSPDTFAAAVAPYAGRTVDAAGLRALASAVAGAARARGYGLATAWIPEQIVTDGRVRVIVDEGRIDEIEASGDAAAAVRRLLLPLAGSGPVTTAELERRTLLAADMAGVSVGKARLDRIGGRNVLRVATRRTAIQGRAYLDNWGSGTIGPVRAHASLDVNGLLAGDDRLSLGGVLTPIDPDEFGLVRAGYAKRVGLDGTEIRIAGYAARSRAGGRLAELDYEGRSLEGSVGLEHPILRTRKASLWSDVELSLRDSEQSLDDRLTRDDRHAILKTSLFFVAKPAGGRARGRVALSRGLGIFDATRERDSMKSRRDGSAVFTKAEFWASFDRSLGGPVSVQLQAEGQLASRPLLSSEEVGLGGRYFLRGYDYREFSGDKGIAGSVELRYDLARAKRPAREMQLYLYADAGSVGNLRDGSGGGSLASAGGGVRAALGRRLDLAVELGVPLARGEFGRTPDPRLSFVIGTRF